MASQPKAHARFHVTSDYLCYGTLLNIWHGSSQSKAQGLDTAPAPIGMGTIIAQSLDYRVPAVNGTWISYQLVHCSSGDIGGKPEFVTAWFVAHEDVEPEAEVGRILKVAGSLYESDTSGFNSPETEAAGVLVINRYDWVQCDEQGEEDMKRALKDKRVAKKKEADGGGKADGKVDKEEFSDEDEDGDADCFHVGLVDSVHAKSQVLEWKTQKDGERTSSSSGVWLYSPERSYMFARFGFNEECTAVRSFLWFTDNTEFTHTAFSGLGKPLLLKRSWD